MVVLDPAEVVSSSVLIVPAAVLVSAAVVDVETDVVVSSAEVEVWLCDEVSFMIVVVVNVCEVSSSVVIVVSAVVKPIPVDDGAPVVKVSVTVLVVAAVDKEVSAAVELVPPTVVVS